LCYNSRDENEKKRLELTARTVETGEDEQLQDMFLGDTEKLKQAAATEANFTAYKVWTLIVHSSDIWLKMFTFRLIKPNNIIQNLYALSGSIFMSSGESSSQELG